MRIYVIGNDGITLCREPLATVIEGEIAVTSKEELQAGPAQRQTAAGVVECTARCRKAQKGR